MTRENDADMKTDDLDFDLPPELIAQTPPQRRTDARLLHYRRDNQVISHAVFTSLPSLLRPGDLLVFNDARVLPARFALRKPTGGRIEGLFLSEPRPGEWWALLRDLGSASIGMQLRFELDPALSTTLLERKGDGEFRLAISPPQPAEALLQRLGRMPLPPYIRRDKQSDPRDELDRQRYQTVYAARGAAVAAPTAGLHFTPELLAGLDAAGIHRTAVTLNVGIGTFRPVTAATLADHVMHTESWSITAPAADALTRAKRDNRRIIAVGTTAARVLESQPDGSTFAPAAGETGICIYPPYRWKHVSALLTNFHLPRSTLIALVAAFTGLEEQRRIYREAIAQRYRFFSYGDAMLLE